MRHHRATPYTFRDRGYMPAPVSHITGLLMAVTLPLVSGCSVVLRERWDAARAVDDMRNYGVTYTGGATVFIQELADAVEAAGLDSLPLSCGYNLGGSAIPLDVVERAEALGFRPRRAYGMTECPTVSASLGDDGPDVRCVTDGRILPGVEVRVVDDDGRDVARGREGEFLVRGPQRVLGYLDAQHTADGFDADGWFRSGDLGVVDDRNCIRVTGRTKDVINRGGEKLSAQEIEGLLRRHPDVSDVAVVAAPHPRLGEEPAAFVIAHGRHRGRRRRAGAVPQGGGRRPAEDPACGGDGRRPAPHRQRQGQEVRARRTSSRRCTLTHEHLGVDVRMWGSTPRCSSLGGQALVGPAVGEVGVALLAEGGDALVDVVAEVHEAAEREAVVERLGQPAVALLAQDALDQLQRDLRHRAHVLRGRHGHVHQLGGRDDLLHEPDAQRVGRFDAGGGQQHPRGVAVVEHPGEQLDRGARDQPALRLHEPEPRGVGGDAEVAGHGDLARHRRRPDR